MVLLKSKLYYGDVYQRKLRLNFVKEETVFGENLVKTQIKSLKLLKIKEIRFDLDKLDPA